MNLIKSAISAVDPSKTSKLANIRPDMEIRELGLDSVATMEMVGYLEEKLETQFSDEVMIRIQTFGDLASLIENTRQA
ncbi:MAG: acyl carrier protein [Deltaproteobacteria bacterium]|nr:acyl carrier protein [Deltaproteobacteria bacterium]